MYGNQTIAATQSIYGSTSKESKFWQHGENGCGSRGSSAQVFAKAGDRRELDGEAIRGLTRLARVYRHQLQTKPTLATEK